MRLGVAILGLLAACYAPSPEAGARCSPAGQCPDPLQCIAMVCQLPGSPPDDAAPHDGPNAITDGNLPPDGPLVCPNGYTMNPFGSCYRSGSAPKAWTDAEHACEQDHAHLVVIQNQAEANGVTGGPIWIGASDRIVEGTYRAVTGPVITYDDFGAGQPASMYDCVYVQDAGSHMWSAGPCDFPFPYVCEYDGTLADPTAY